MIALPDHCLPTERWLTTFSSAFNICVPTNLAFISTALGTCSIISWLFAQLPQIFKNWRLKSASGLSIYFLAEWLLGDLTNLLGALLTDQAAWQVIVAAYYVIVDICLLLQYVWYVHAKPWRKARVVEFHPGHDGGHGEGTVTTTLDGISPAPDSSVSSAASRTKDAKKEAFTNKQTLSRHNDKSEPAVQSLPFNEKTASPSAIHAGRRRQPLLLPSPQIPILTSLLCVALTSASPLHPHILLLARDSSNLSPLSSSSSSAEFAGRILSWTSTILYLFSRIPQIYKNFRRRSTSGLSPTLFIAAFFGNLFYSTSILTNPQAWASYPPYGLHGWVGKDGSEREEWVARAIPFFLGAAGVLIMDAIVGGQFLVYGDGAERVEVLIDDSDDDSGGGGKDQRKRRGRWTTVNGWMRGWVPSPKVSPERRVVVEDDVEDNMDGMVGEESPLLNPRRRRDEGHDDHDQLRYGGVSM